MFRLDKNRIKNIKFCCLYCSLWPAASNDQIKYKTNDVQFFGRPDETACFVTHNADRRSSDMCGFALRLACGCVSVFRMEWASMAKMCFIGLCSMCGSCGPFFRLFFRFLDIFSLFHCSTQIRVLSRARITWDNSLHRQYWKKHVDKCKANAHACFIEMHVAQVCSPDNPFFTISSYIARFSRISFLAQLHLNDRICLVCIVVVFLGWWW